VALDFNAAAWRGPRRRHLESDFGRAMSKVVHAVSLALGVDEDTVIKSAKLSVLTADSIKARARRRLERRRRPRRRRCRRCSVK
jgi:hypothetical protein